MEASWCTCRRRRGWAERERWAVCYLSRLRTLRAQLTTMYMGKVL